jgi:periplasmic mercuric ion binding protein
MKKLLVLPILALLLITFQAKAQDVEAKNQDMITSSTIQNSTTIKFKITGITCAGCSNAIYNALMEVDGVLEHSVEYPGDIAIIEYDNSKTNADELIKVIEEKGFKAEELKD